MDRLDECEQVVEAGPIYIRDKSPQKSVMISQYVLVLVYFWKCSLLRGNNYDLATIPMQCIPHALVATNQVYPRERALYIPEQRGNSQLVSNLI